MRWNDLPGQRFGPYEILEEIGRGGTSRVYRARNYQRNREVAFKIMPNDADDRVAFIQRFIRETEIIRKLNHPNIVRVYDAGETDEFVYLAMRLAMGVTLRQLAAQQRMSAQEAAQYMIQAANALHHAHTQGIIHRDVKPSNMLIPNDNPALLLLSDFGTAKILGARGPTKTGATIGTPEYMSPEQAEGREVDQRSDIYSLGCTLYEALAGRPPFIGAPVSVLYQQVHAQPTYIRSYNNTVPRELWNVLKMCLAKRPEDRYGSAERVAEELLPFAEGLIQPTPAPWRAPVTERLSIDLQDRPTNRTLRAQSPFSYDGGPQATPQITPLPPPFTPAPSPIMPGQSSWPGFGPPTPRSTLRPRGGMGSEPLSGGLTPTMPPAGRGPVRTSGPLGGGPPTPTRAPGSQPGPFSGVGNTPYGSRSAPSGPTRGPVSSPRPGVPSGPRPRVNSGPLQAPQSGTDWPAMGSQPPAGYRGAQSGPMRGSTSGPMRDAPNSLYRSAQSGPMRGSNSRYGARVGVASGPRSGAGRRGAPPTTPLRTRLPWGPLAAGVVALLLLGGAMALGAAGMGLLPGQAAAARPTASAAPTATLSPTATETPKPPTATPTANTQQILDRQAAAAFRGITIAPFTDSSCSVGNQATSYSGSQAVYVNLCTASKSMPGPVTVAARKNGVVVWMLFNRQYLSSNTWVARGHTLPPGNYDMLVTVTINGKTATAKDIPFTVS